KLAEFGELYCHGTNPFINKGANEAAGVSVAAFGVGDCRDSLLLAPRKRPVGIHPCRARSRDPGLGACHQITSALDRGQEMTANVWFAVCLLFILVAPLAIAGLALINTGLGRSRSAAHAMTSSLCVLSLAMLIYFAWGGWMEG